MLPAGVESEVSVYELEVAKYRLVEEESSERANDAQVQCRCRLHQQDSNSPHPPKNYMEGVLVTRLIIEPKVVYGIQAALAAGPAFFCLSLIHI